jgi:hypothetical protein
MSQDELEEMIYDSKYGYWSDEQDEKLNGLQKDLEKLQIESINYAEKPLDLARIKDGIRKAKVDILKLDSRKNRYRYLTVNGFADSIRLSEVISRLILIGTSPAPDFTDAVLNWMGENLIREEDYRDLVKHDPWNSMWSAGKTAQELWGVPSTAMTDEQRHLFIWSLTYDNVRQYTEDDKPSDTVINDDDMLDGWFILQRKKKEKGQTENKWARRMSKVPSNAQEVFLLADKTQPEEIQYGELREVEGLNTTNAKFQKARRAKALKEKGELNEAELPDVREKLAQAISRRMK